MVNGQSVAAIAEKPRSAAVAAAGFPASANLTFFEKRREITPVKGVRSVPLYQAHSGLTPQLRILLNGAPHTWPKEYILGTKSHNSGISA